MRMAQFKKAKRLTFGMNMPNSNSSDIRKLKVRQRNMYLHCGITTIHSGCWARNLTISHVPVYQVHLLVLAAAVKGIIKALSCCHALQ